MPTSFLAIGQVLRPHGVRGEMLLKTLTEFPEHLAEIKTVYLGPADAEAPTAHPVRQVRLHHRDVLLQLDDCRTREAAEAHRGQVVFIRAEQAAPLPPGRYYHHQIIGLTVVADDGEVLGTLTEILQTGANDVYVVQGPPPAPELLLPAIHSVIRHIDLEAKTMTVHLIEGLR